LAPSRPKAPARRSRSNSGFLNDAVESDFPERLASEEHDREPGDAATSDDPDAWEPRDLDRVLASAPSLARLIDDVWRASSRTR